MFTLMLGNFLLCILFIYTDSFYLINDVSGLTIGLSKKGLAKKGKGTGNSPCQFQVLDVVDAFKDDVDEGLSEAEQEVEYLAPVGELNNVEGVFQIDAEKNVGVEKKVDGENESDIKLDVDKTDSANTNTASKENPPKITEEDVMGIDPLKLFGDWAQSDGTNGKNIVYKKKSSKSVNNGGSDSGKKFLKADEYVHLQVSQNPFKHVVINNFLNEDLFNKIQKTMPNPPKIDATSPDPFWKYNNPLEVKYACDNFNVMGEDIRSVFYGLSHPSIIQKMSDMFGMKNLEYDPHCHGGGLHMHPRNGRLNLHLDYEKHPITKKQRRLNVIIYLNENWNKAWHGDTQLWSKDLKELVKTVYPERNTALIFETSELSWHGVPEIMECPVNTFRKTLAYFYVSPLENKSNMEKNGVGEDGFRTKATFAKRPQDPQDERMEKLYKIRPYRRIEQKDMEEVWPEWTPEFRYPSANTNGNTNTNNNSDKDIIESSNTNSKSSNTNYSKTNKNFGRFSIKTPTKADLDKYGKNGNTSKTVYSKDSKNLTESKTDSFLSREDTDTNVAQEVMQGNIEDHNLYTHLYGGFA